MLKILCLSKGYNNGAAVLSTVLDASIRCVYPLNQVYVHPDWLLYIDFSETNLQ